MTITSDTVSVITGASSGIGESLALELARRGAGKVALVARRESLLEEVAAKVRALGGVPLVVVADVTDEQQARGAMRRAIAHFGRVDLLVNNAGRGNRASVEDTSTEMLNTMFALNVYSLWWATSEVLPGMKERGRGHIATISSVAGKMAFPFNSAYVAAKHAAVGFVAGLRAELTGTGVEATVVCPAGVETEWAAVTEGGAIGDIFARGIRNSRTIAREQGLALAPLTPMMSAKDVAAMILDNVNTGAVSDLFTHEGTYEQAVQAAADRPALEESMKALYLGMSAAYYNTNE